MKTPPSVIIIPKRERTTHRIGIIPLRLVTHNLSVFYIAAAQAQRIYVRYDLSNNYGRLLVVHWLDILKTTLAIGSWA